MCLFACSGIGIHKAYKQPTLACLYTQERCTCFYTRSDAWQGVLRHRGAPRAGGGVWLLVPLLCWAGRRSGSSREKVAIRRMLVSGDVRMWVQAIEIDYRRLALACLHRTRAHTHTHTNHREVSIKDTLTVLQLKFGYLASLTLHYKRQNHSKWRYQNVVGWEAKLDGNDDIYYEMSGPE